MTPRREYRLADDVAAGGGALWDIGCYAVHTLRHAFGVEPRSVVAVGAFAASGADTAMSGVLDFGDGRLANFAFSFNQSRRCSYEIIGTRGGVQCDVVWQLPGDVPLVRWWCDDGRRVDERLPPANHFRLQVEAFSRAVLARSDAELLPLSDAANNCRTLRAIYLAATTHQRVTIE